MELHDLMLARRTIHEYRSEKIAESLLHQAFEVAVYAPNHKHTHPWKFLRIGGETRSQLMQLAIRLQQKARGGELPPPMLEKLKEKFLNSAELIVLLRKQNTDNFSAREDFASIACAVQNMSLLLWSEGVGCKWGTGPVTRHPSTYELLSVDSSKEAIEGFLYVGIAQSETRTPPKPNWQDCVVELP